MNTLNRKIALTNNGLFSLRSAAPQLSDRAVLSALLSLIDSIAEDKGFKLEGLVCENPELEQEALEQVRAGNFLTSDQFLAEIRARQKPVTGGLSEK